MDYNKSHLIAQLGLWFGLIIGVIGASIENVFIAYLGVMLMVGGLIQAFIFYKCPNCNKPFKIRSNKPQYCPECGEKLEKS